MNGATQASQGATQTGTPPAQCHTLAELRREIDALDARIVPLLVQRCGYVAQAARIKQDASQIVDVARIEAIVARVREQASALGGPPEVLEAAYRALIAASIEYERAEFVRLRSGAQAEGFLSESGARR